jgi:hypothetical protein
MITGTVLYIILSLPKPVDKGKFQHCKMRDITSFGQNKRFKNDRSYFIIDYKYVNNKNPTSDNYMKLYLHKLLE